LRDAEADAVVIERPTTTAAMSERAEDEIRVPVIEERLTVGKREIELGEIAIRTTVTEEERTVPVRLTHEEVRIEERAVAGRPATGTEHFTEETIRVPVRGEEAVVAKEVVVTGEVVVEKEQVIEEGRLTGTVRKEQVEVEEKLTGSATTGAQERTIQERDPHRR